MSNQYALRGLGILHVTRQARETPHHVEAVWDSRAYVIYMSVIVWVRLCERVNEHGNRESNLGLKFDFKI